METPTPKAGWLERLGALLMREPEDREQLAELLRSSYERNLLDSDALSMIEGVLQVSEMQARDIMIPRSQMDVIDIRQAPDKFIPLVIETNHSRFPVTGESRDDIIGILLAKDLLRYYAGEEEFNVRDMLRPAVFIPESKRLNVLLKDFRANRNHMAIVVDEYGGVAGLVTIEDVLEQIVGDIEDEYDFDETEDDIIADKVGSWRVKATTEIAKFNEVLHTQFSEEDHDTIGGLVLERFGRVPKRGEQIAIDKLNFKVLRADSRRVHLLLVEAKGYPKKEPVEK
jgi:magnesium and cobalt transporter